MEKSGAMLSDFYTNFHQGGIDNSELGVEQPEEQNCVYNFRHNSRKVIDNAENTFSLNFLFINTAIISAKTTVNIVAKM